MCEDIKTVVVTDWDNKKSCMFARKCWVNPKNVDREKEYEKGDFLRVYCDHDQMWCSCEFWNTQDCVICSDHTKE